jgi:hypothetical protein
MNNETIQKTIGQLTAQWKTDIASNTENIQFLKGALAAAEVIVQQLSKVYNESGKSSGEENVPTPIGDRPPTGPGTPDGA